MFGVDTARMERRRNSDVVAAVFILELENLDGDGIDVRTVASDLNTVRNGGQVERIVAGVCRADGSAERGHEGLRGGVALAERSEAHGARAAIPLSGSEPGARRSNRR